MISNNVITFPKKLGANTTHISKDDIDNNLELMRHYHIQETLALIIPHIFTYIDLAGFDMPDPDSPEGLSDIKDGAFVIEAIRSLLCKYYGMYHPFQTVVENIFEPDEENEGVLRIVEELAVELKKTETN